jgi:hypothetical protein
MSALRLPNKAPRASGPGPVESITIASGSLAEAVAAREGAKVASLLDNLTLYLADKPWNTVPVDTLVVAWTLCGEVLDAALGREVSMLGS